MKWSLLLVLLSIAPLSGLLVIFAQDALAQGPASAETAQTTVELVNLFPPVYPPLPRQARIMGDVKVQMGIRRDGSVASAEVISGHAMLKQAALESAKKSMFLCQGCSEEVTAYSLTYTFGFRDDGNCGITTQRSAKCLYLWKCGIPQEPARRPAVVGQSLNRVIILADSMCVETTRSTTGP